MSTIKVENLTGLSSGANANKIIVPSGQTLDASEGFTPPSGHVIQYIPATYATFSSRAQTTSTGYVDAGYSLTITPKSATNLILISYHLSAYVDSASHYIYAIIHKSTTNSLLLQTNNAIGLGGWFSLSSSASDVAGTTSAITYKIQTKVSGGTGYLGWSGSGYSSPSQNFNCFHLMEIAA